MMGNGRFFGIVIGAVVVLSAAAGFYLVVLKGGSSEVPDERREPLRTAATVTDDWTVTNVSNSIDGDTSGITKVFQFTNHQSRIEVTLTCVHKTKGITVKLESYDDTEVNGSYPGKPFVAEMGSDNRVHPAGRIKIGDLEAVPLGEIFLQDNYRNVISWDVLSFAKSDWDRRTRALQSPQLANLLVLSQGGTMDFGILKGNPKVAAFEAAYREGYAKIGAGNVMRTYLPIVIEVLNGGGTQQVTIPAENSLVNGVIESCTVEGLPDMATAASAANSSSNEGLDAVAPENYSESSTNR